MNELIEGVAIFALGMASVTCGLLAWRLFRGNRIEYDRNRRRSPSILKAVKGEIPTTHEGGRDYRVSAGIAVNRKNEWVEQGRISSEALSATVRPPGC